MSHIQINDINKDQILILAIEKLKKGSIIAYPTETFYGLGVKFDIEDSLKKLYDIKQRPKEKALPLIIGDISLLSVLTGTITLAASYLIERHWPGPLTLIFRAKKELSDYITAGTNKVAVRIPGVSFALHLAQRTRFPITATSANPSGMPPARNSETVMKYFGDKIDLVIDNGPSPGGLPSTIVDVTGDKIKILREGKIKKEQLTFT